MPPPISDDEVSDTNDVVQVPISSNRRGKKASVGYKDDDEDDDIKDVPPYVDAEQLDNGDNDDDVEAGGEDDEDDEEIGEDEFVVEKIVGHQVLPDGTIKFKVKWEGYEKKKDQTFEDEDNLKENASLILREYLESVGGRQQILDETETAVSQQSAKKRGRPAGSASGGTPANGKRTKRGSHPASQTPPASVSSKEWKPPAGSWEDDISYVDACHDETTGKLVVYLTWRNGHKTQHDLKVVYSRCPQQMLRFYERHVKIVKTTADANME
ncbi:chromo domain-containing protein [Apiospora kogelbergensis]|uniref:Chromo domain-containing protein n=1 Tax=Apiospora kogelbergensis TaxID=1337665 RepID=A0AAW0QDE0_9PEZI